MNQFHFQDEEALRAQHISDEEARQVVALWAEQQKEREERAAQPTVQAMAEGLDVPPEEVLRLLREVRTREAAQKALQDQQQAVSRRQRRRVGTRLMAMGIAMVSAVLFVLLLSVRQVRRDTAMEAMPEMAQIPPMESGARTEAGIPGNYIKRADGSIISDSPQGHYERHADGSVLFDSPQGHYEYHADGTLNINRPQGSYLKRADGTLEIHGAGGVYIRRPDGSEERNGTPPTISAPTPPPGLTLPAVPEP